MLPNSLESEISCLLKLQSDVSEYLQSFLETRISGSSAFLKQGESRLKKSFRRIHRNQIQKENMSTINMKKHQKVTRRVTKEIEAQEKEARDEQVTLVTQKTLFPAWSMERILNEAIENLGTHWLESTISFELENTLESQIDLPITPRAFLFRCFEKVEKAPIPYYDVNHILFTFYLKYESLNMKPRVQRRLLS
ncbi:unnamed protein product [Lactuca saligna]|uniref:Uncharacterized protein n=1 Tax=Lactuca saligna TaxID=75948 RepID=A0AA35Y4Q7_LACSI|nr:unnamed protein product [Lactuca saligna]